MPRYDYDFAYQTRRRGVRRDGRHARGKLTGRRLGYGYPDYGAGIAPGYYSGGGRYREVTDPGDVAPLTRSDRERLRRHAGGGGRRRGPDRVLGRPYVGEYRARLEREQYGRTIDRPERYTAGYLEPGAGEEAYRDLFRGGWPWPRMRERREPITPARPPARPARAPRARGRPHRWEPGS